MNRFNAISQPPARGYFRNIFGDAIRKASGNCLVCCPFHNDRSPSLSVDLNGGKFHCFGCGAHGGDIIDFHRMLTGCDFKEAVSAIGLAEPISLPEIDIEVRTKASTENLIKFMETVWSGGSEIQSGDRVDQYMKRRGLSITQYPATLRFHESLKYKHDDMDYGFFPAMLAMVQSLNGDMVCVHRTYLSNLNNGKAEVPKPKKLMPCAISGATKGAAIRLFPAAKRLALAEGIETALAFSQLTGIASWATVSAVGMENIQLPAEVEEVYLCVDVDSKGRGEQAVDVAATRLLAEDRKIFKAIPPGYLLEGVKSRDWADFLEEAAQSDNVDEVENVRTNQ